LAIRHLEIEFKSASYSVVNGFGSELLDQVPAQKAGGLYKTYRAHGWTVL
jgi:hypothetical protein